MFNIDKFVLFGGKSTFFNVYGSLVDDLFKSYGLNDRIVIHNTGLEGLFSSFCWEATDLSRSKAKIFDRTALIFHRIVQVLSRLTSPQPDAGVNAEAMQMKQWLDCRLTEHVTVHDLARHTSARTTTPI